MTGIAEMGFVAAPTADLECVPRGLDEPVFGLDMVWDIVVYVV